MLQTSAPSETAADASVPQLSTTAPRQYVHRAALAEVFLTSGWTRHDEAHFTMGAQWPRAHSFFGPLGGGHYDPMMAAETIRQVGALLAHVGFDVPLGHQFLMWELNYRVTPGRMAVGGAPAELRLDVTCTDIRRRAGRLTGLSYEVEISENGRTLASGDARYTCTSPEVYRRLRADRPVVADLVPGLLPEPVEPALVGRLSPFDVVLSAEDAGETGDRWRLRVNTAHPVLFDHPGDHIPGMVLLEAARQAVRSRAPRGLELMPVAMDSAYHRYAEFGSPVWIEIDQAVDYPGTSESLVSVSGRQDDELVFTAITTVAPCPR
ncbi:ScbA/BarX family gamma-butyrolactone biosynthesis protein [Streptomyces sp. NPDC048604]|uniref:ScbA/BarX family gamma-butyrolactone biosynthesis protein n=1 Tax=Streptomyces sp. NPDC048604 TaxID=3365578 RepID=UPI00371E2332